MALSQAERTKKYLAKHGIKAKKFDLDPDTIALLERLAKQRGQTQVAVFKDALKALEKETMA